MNTYQKWMDFSTRLIDIMDVTDERREKILNIVRSFISRFDPDWVRRAVDIRGDESDDMNVWL